MDIRELGSMALIIVVATFIISVGSTMLGQLSTTPGVNTTIVNYGVSGISTFAQWIPLISLVVVLAIVIGVIVSYMGRSTGM